MFKLPVAIAGLSLAAFAWQETSTGTIESWLNFGVLGCVLLAVGMGIREGWVFIKLTMWPDVKAFLAKIASNAEAQTAAINDLARQTAIQHQQIIDLDQRLMDALLAHDARSNGERK